ncbi:MAG TPA: GntR family transcriptional regulator [Terriglobia bacterium]|nr:GntR family transcriptional regulator [Terriglobia bacterium]
MMNFGEPGRRQLSEAHKIAVTKNLRVPLYLQIREEIRSDIGRMEAGQPIPTERELESRFGVSRMTIRGAIDDLVIEGLLVRQQGRGTFVQKPKLTHDLNTITSWTEQLENLGYVPRTSQLEIEEIDAPERVAFALSLKKDARVVRIRRVRLASQEPITLMVNYLPSRLVPRLAERIPAHESLYEALEKEYGLAPASAVDTVESRSSTDDEARRLKIEPWAPVICVTRVSHLEDERPLELAQAVSRADRYQYRVKLRGRLRLRRT